MIKVSPAAAKVAPVLRLFLLQKPGCTQGSAAAELPLARCSCRCFLSISGSVPAYYREVYEAVCGRTDERVHVEVFQRLLQKTDLSRVALGQVSSSYFKASTFSLKAARSGHWTVISPDASPPLCSEECRPQLKGGDLDVPGSLSFPDC